MALPAGAQAAAAAAAAAAARAPQRFSAWVVNVETGRRVTGPVRTSHEKAQEDADTIQRMLRLDGGEALCSRWRNGEIDEQDLPALLGAAERSHAPSHAGQPPEHLERDRHLMPYGNNLPRGPSSCAGEETPPPGAKYLFFNCDQRAWGECASDPRDWEAAPQEWGHQPQEWGREPPERAPPRSKQQEFAPRGRGRMPSEWDVLPPDRAAPLAQQEWDMGMPPRRPPMKRPFARTRPASPSEPKEEDAAIWWRCPMPGCDFVVATDEKNRPQKKYNHGKKHTRAGENPRASPKVMSRTKPR